MTLSNNQEKYLKEVVGEFTQEISRLIIQEHKILSEELLRMSKILADAVVNMRECFNVMNNEIVRQSTGMLQTDKENNSNKHTNTLLKETNQDNSYENMAVRALQFEDIVQQLISHSCHRIENIEKIFKYLQTEIEKLDKVEEFDVNTISRTLKECIKEISRVKKSLNMSNPVKQDSLQEGDVTLF